MAATTTKKAEQAAADSSGSSSGGTVTQNANSTNSGSRSRSLLARGVVGAILLQLLWWICWEAYRIRLYAVQEFGRVIHEFDPYFNYRATEYLYEHGWYQFRTWFDYKVWYPLGRPVGTTIYPGMQVTVVLLKEYLLKSWSINDICVFVPAWFGVTATLAVAWLTYECARCGRSNFGSLLHNLPGVATVYRRLICPAVRSAADSPYLGAAWGLQVRPQSALVAPLSAVLAAAIMAVVPAHLLRSIAGGYDNESIAMTALCLTFACWCWALRDGAGSDDNNNNQIFATVAGTITGLAYFYMVAAWGGYVFVLNVIGVHATVLVLLGRYSTKLHRAYTAFYLVGTALAIQVPVVGWTPLKSLEQLGPFVAFGGMQLIEICEIVKRRRRLTPQQAWALRATVFGGAAAAACVVVLLLAPTGYFGPISSRVRGLFVKHTKTGNPLVDSVAEHQAASPQAYFQYLHDVCYLAPVAFGVTALFYFNDSSSFLIVYGTAAYFFSHRMVRLILLTAPIASALGGIFFGRVGVWMLNGADELLFGYVFVGDESDSADSKKTDEAAAADETVDAAKVKKNGGRSGKATKPIKKKEAEETKEVSSKSGLVRPIILTIRLAVSVFLIRESIPYFVSFQAQSHAIAKQISHPTIIQKGQTKSGETVVIDDYREAYFWLRDHTPEDARIMAWWDYGYQITGIANRTTIADGNTWNHEHIALLGRVLTAPEKDAHRIARHMADYVLVWAGGGGDDVAKSPHLRRIANSVYRGLCREPTCREFGFYSDHTPTDDMANSLLYKLHSNGIESGVEADRNRFQEKFRSKHGKVRIYKIQSVSKESKEWVENNKVCDAPGSWFCRGQYPPALKKVLAEKKDFKQLEDFNFKGTGEDDSAYQKEYFDNLLGDKKNQPANRERAKKAKLTPDQIDLINEEWMDNEMTSMMYQLIASDSFDQLSEMLLTNPQLAHVRSEDGRGPMWWAHEFKRPKIIKMLKTLGVSETRTDEHGLTPLDI